MEKRPLVGQAVFTRHLRTTGARALGVAVAFSLAATMVAAPAQADDLTHAGLERAISKGLTAAAPVYASGASDDRSAIAAAATSYADNEATSDVRLADVASQQKPLPLISVDGKNHVDAPNGTAVTVDPVSGATLSSGTGDEIVVTVEGSDIRAEAAAGSTVQSEITPSTNLVIRATANGAQFVAILKDEKASGEVPFAFDLPEGSKLTPQADGSIAISADVSTEQPAPGEEARISREVDAVLADITDLNELSEDKLASLDAIAPAKMNSVVENQQVASLAAPWAVDANGKSLPTSYEVSGNVVRQIINTEGAAFPIVADPDLWWVIGSSVVCAAEIASLAVGVAKVVQAFAKADKIVKGAKAVVKAYNVLGGKMDKVFALIKKYVKSKSSLTKAQINALEAFIKQIGKMIFNVIGLGTCYSLVTAK